MRRLPLAVTLACMAGAALAQDPMSKDHALVPRYPGSEPTGGPMVVRDFDEFPLVLGRVTGENKAAKMQTVAGRVSTVTYHNPEGRSTLEIYRNYEQGLLKAGFQALYSCSGEPCGAFESVGETRFRDPSYQRRFLVARLARPAGDVYVSLLVQAQTANMAGDTQLVIIETKAMETGLVVVDAKALGSGIAGSGHVAVYGILFDTGKADVRAQAVVQALVAQGVAAARLRPDGVGPLAPVAPNTAEEGRARNRRVELVAQ